VSVDRYSLGSDLMKLAQWSSDVEFESRGTILRELSKLGKGTGAGGRDDFISTG